MHYFGVKGRNLTYLEERGYFNGFFEVLCHFYPLNSFTSQCFSKKISLFWILGL
jgi:hypothetical protein